MTILSTCQIEGETSNYRLQFLIDQHKAEITRILQELCKQGFLASEYKGRWTTYHLNTAYLSEVEKIEIIGNTSSKIIGNTSGSIGNTSSEIIGNTSDPIGNTSKGNVLDSKGNIKQRTPKSELQSNILFFTKSKEY